MKMTRVLLGGLIALCVAATARSEEITRIETLPAPGKEDLTGSLVELTYSDFWVFTCPAGGSAVISVDTLPDIALEVSTSSLDPYLFVYFDQFGIGGAVASGDEDFPCSATPTCTCTAGPCECPSVDFDCIQGGEYTILVSTFNCGGVVGNYELSVEVFDSPGGMGTSLSAEQVGLGGQTPIRVFQWGKIPGGPAFDDVGFDEFSVPVAVGPAAEDGLEYQPPSIQTRKKTKPSPPPR